MLMAKSMKKMLRQTFSMFEPEQCLEMGNHKYSFDSKFHHNLADGTGVFILLFFFVLGWYILFILSFGCVTIVSREMKSVSAI